MKQQKLDVIGDVHGYVDELIELLTILGYRQEHGRWRAPPNQHVLFLGDLIDRGPQPLQVVAVARSLKEQGLATVLMGNHEFNALAWHIGKLSPPHPQDTVGEPLRPHLPHHLEQHRTTLAALQHETPEGLQSFLDFLMECPISAIGQGIVAVHACWHPDTLQRLGSILPIANNGLFRTTSIDTSFLQKACIKDSIEHDSVEILLKGPEFSLPENYSYQDINGIVRKKSRLRWWLNQDDLMNCKHLHDIGLMPENKSYDPPYPLSDSFKMAFKPLLGTLPTSSLCFIGHYWMNIHQCMLSPQLACLDTSIAKGGHLCAYRFCGESQLLPSSFYSVPQRRS